MRQPAVGAVACEENAALLDCGLHALHFTDRPCAHCLSGRAAPDRKASSHRVSCRQMVGSSFPSKRSSCGRSGGHKVESSSKHVIGARASFVLVPYQARRGNMILRSSRFQTLPATNLERQRPYVFLSGGVKKMLLSSSFTTVMSGSSSSKYLDGRA